MAYLRKRGNQLAIVHGERDPETRRVQQRILFTIYSKAEAREAIGRGTEAGPHVFRSQLERQYPSVRFDWEKIEGEIAKNLGVLPDEYSYREQRLTGRFREDLRAFARQLMLADPVSLSSAAELIRENQFELEFLSELIASRLRDCSSEPSEWSADNPFFWHYQLQGEGAPGGVEEVAEAILEQGDLDRAEAVFRFLIECFGEYAEGFNYLGVIAWERGDLESALEHFVEAMHHGRKRFPRRLPRDEYWTDLDTRPYVRALRNYALTLLRLGRVDEALLACVRLEEECGDDATASVYRASLYLNVARWGDAAECSRRVCGLWPEESLVAALALWEMGEQEEALVSFLHGAINRPRSARMLVGRRSRKPQGYDEVRDHNDGVSLLQNLDPYRRSVKGKRTRRSFRRILEAPQVDAMLGEIADVVRRRARQHPKGEREAFERMSEMQSPEYARERAEELAPLLPEILRTRRAR